MNTKSLEPALNLNKEQANKLIQSYIEKNDPNEIFEMIINALMKSERSEFLRNQEEPNNKANGYRPRTKIGMKRSLALSIPRDRLGIFKPFILGILNQEQELLNELAFSLYGNGLSTSQTSRIIEETFGKKYCKASISNITKEFKEYVKMWLERQLDQVYPIVFIDALFLKVRRDTVASEAFYVVLGVKKDLTREVLAVVNMPTESATGWEDIFKKLQERGVKKVGIFVSDDLKGIGGAIEKTFQDSDHQKCIVHFKRNLLKKLRKKDREDFLKAIKQVFNPDFPFNDIPEQVDYLKRVLAQFSIRYPALKQTIKRDDLFKYFTYLKYDVSIRRMIYSTNWIERFNKSVKRTTKIRNSFPSPESAIALIGFVAMDLGENHYSYPIKIFANDKKILKFSNE